MTDTIEYQIAEGLDLIDQFLASISSLTLVTQSSVLDFGLDLRQTLTRQRKDTNGDRSAQAPELV